MITYRTAIIGCSRMGAFIDNEVGDLAAVMRPFSHAAGYRACPRTRIVACSDVREEVMARFGEEYDVSGEKRYADYRDMIKRESPDIVSVATQPEQRAEIVIHAANHGVKAIYAEKALAASLEEAKIRSVRMTAKARHVGPRFHPSSQRAGTSEDRCAG